MEKLFGVRVLWSGLAFFLAEGGFVTHVLVGERSDEPVPVFLGGVGYEPRELLSMKMDLASESRLDHKVGWCKPFSANQWV